MQPLCSPSVKYFGHGERSEVTFSHCHLSRYRLVFGIGESRVCSFHRQYRSFGGIGQPPGLSISTLFMFMFQHSCSLNTEQSPRPGSMSTIDTKQAGPVVTLFTLSHFSHGKRPLFHRHCAICTMLLRRLALIKMCRPLAHRCWHGRGNEEHSGNSQNGVRVFGHASVRRSQ